MLQNTAGIVQFGVQNAEIRTFNAMQDEITSVCYILMSFDGMSKTNLAAICHNKVKVSTISLNKFKSCLMEVDWGLCSHRSILFKC